MLHRLRTICTLLAAISSNVCFGAIVQRFADLPALEYDFIVVGGGTAGLAVANRLTEEPQFSVLVVESGGSNLNVLDSMVPFFNGHLFKTANDWNYTTVPQRGLNGRAFDYPQGHILGGSSSLNGLAYTRGTSDDYDRYAKLTNDRGWSWDSIQPYLRKNERWTLPADHHNTTGQFDPSVHGFTGINSVSLPGFTHRLDHRVIQATAQLPREFPFNLDMNSGHHIGIGWTQSTIKGGERSSSATSYLAPQYAQRPNLHVLLHARVSRVLRTGSTKGKPSFRTVEFTEMNSGTQTRITARKELILSAGTIGTPHILQNSGIGDSNHLSLVGVKPLVHLPSVGQNFSDHAFVSNPWLVNATDTFEAASRNATVAAEQLSLWKQRRRGPLVDGTFNVAGWLRLPDNATVFDNFPDPAAGPNTAHFEFIISNGISRLPAPPTGNFMDIGTAVVTPLSRGSVLINSSNPFDTPMIDPNLLGSDFDIAVIREAIRSARRFVEAPVWADYIIASTVNATSDAELDQYIRGSSITVSHAVGTSAMSPKGAPFGVVDPDLLVKMVLGLRVVDASVLPLVPAAHTQAATYVVAERAADLIKAAWS